MKRPIQIMQRLEEASKNVEFFPTGFSRLDEHLEGGFFRQEVVVIGASTGIGKSYLSCQMAYNIAQESYRVGIFSLEISAEMIISRLLGQIANVRSGVIKSGQLAPSDLRPVTEAKAKLAGLDKFFEIHDDMFEYDKIEKAMRAGKYDLVVIDFLQNCAVPGMQTEYTAITHAIRSFQNLAKELNCCVLVLSQLSNTAQRETDTEYLEYKGSGAIAHACDLGFKLTRDYALGTMDLKLMKNRRGSPGEFRLEIGNKGGKIIEQRYDKQPKKS